MRKTLLFTILILSMLFAGCSHDTTQSSNNDYVTLTVHHNTTTRVDFDGYHSTWSDGDYLNVVVDGIDDICVFNYNAMTEGDFVCSNLVLPSSENDFYAFYGVSADDIDIENKTATVTLGSPTQVQSKESAMSHIAQYDILYGKSLGVNNSIDISMNHSVVAIKFNMINSLQETVTIKGVSVTVSEGIVLSGTHSINLLDDEIIYAAEDGSNSVQLLFEEPILLEADGTHTAWIAASPFELADGDTITVDITTTDDEVYSCTKTVSAEGLVFAAGSVMSTSVGLGDNCQLVKPDVPSEPELPSEITITVDPTVDGVIPSDFPTSVEDKVTNGEFLLSGYTFGFESEVPLYCTTSNRIRFEGITSTKTASILLPRIDGYILDKVTLASIDENKNRGYRFAVLETISEDNITTENYEILTSKPTTFDVTLSGPNSNCYIYVYHKTSNANKYADLTYIQLHYKKI
ncbi:MAG: fimbrillin family protein [Bacteroidales bacterium]|nr:fimbrillin family protein [Bacteroidales bacterium]